MNLKTKYGGVDVEYDERENVWVFEVRGRERRVASLAKAKEIIDKPEPQEKPPFTRFKAWHRNYGAFTYGEVTSEAAVGGYRGGHYYWFVFENKRSKVSGNELYPQSVHNDEIVKQWSQMREQIDVLRNKQESLLDKLKSCA